MPSPTPHSLGYRMPAEWEPHEATWLSWPHNPETWPGKFDPIPKVWLEMIRHLTRSEFVHLNVNDAAMEKNVRAHLHKSKIDDQRVLFHHFPTDDCWMRDNGPIFVTRNGEGARLAITDWIFNKWGAKYPPWNQDNLIPGKIAKALDLPHFEIPIVLEGGSIDVNGKGTLLTTEACLLNPNRNPHLNRNEIENYFKDYLGISHVLWLKEGIVGDDTDGHIDDIARFVGPHTVLAALEENPADENHAILEENLSRLSKMKDQEGASLEITTLPMPGPIIYEGQRLPASYANFYIANKCVLVPTYRHTNDVIAIDKIAKLFPDREVVGLDATDLIWGLGAFHCITQQQPYFFSNTSGKIP